MSLKKLISNSANYNLWVSEQLVAWLRKYPEELLHKECPSSFSSIAKTLKHISDTQLYWSSIIRGVATPEFDSVGAELEVSNEMNNLVNEAKLLATYVNENHEELKATYLIESEWFSCNFEKYEYLQHLIIHTTNHRGQIVTIGHHLEITDAPMMDYNFWNVQNNINGD